MNKLKEKFGFEFWQKFGKALMVVIAVMPAAGLMSGAPQQEVFRELNPADFLSREEVTLDTDKISGYLTGKTRRKAHDALHPAAVGKRGGQHGDHAHRHNGGQIAPDRLHHPTTFRKHTTEISSMSAQAPVMASR